MIRASDSQEHFRSRSLLPKSVLQLQRLIRLHADRRKAYRAAAILAKDSRLIALVEHTEPERDLHGVTLQNILWGDGHESTSRIDNAQTDQACFGHVNASQETSLRSILQRLLDFDAYICSCYENVLSTIQGRGIRQLLSEQATAIRKLRTTLTELLNSHDAPSPSAESKPLNIKDR